MVSNVVVVSLAVTLTSSSSDLLKNKHLKNGDRLEPGAQNRIQAPLNALFIDLKLNSEAGL